MGHFSGTEMHQNAKECIKASLVSCFAHIASKTMMMRVKANAGHSAPTERLARAGGVDAFERCLMHASSTAPHG